MNNYFYNQSFRYGVIGIKDMIRDLKYWETLLTSSMMQRPVNKLIEDKDFPLDENEESWE